MTVQGPTSFFSQILIGGPADQTSLFSDDRIDIFFCEKKMGWREYL